MRLNKNKLRQQIRNKNQVFPNYLIKRYTISENIRRPKLTIRNDYVLYLCAQAALMP